jgi:hypothetical protein
MSRTALTAQTLKGPYPVGGTVSATQLDVTEAASDASNGNSFPFSGKEVLLLHNTDSGAQTVDLTSASDARGRSADIAGYSIGAGKIAMFDFRGGLDGWLQVDGNVYFKTSSALVKAAVLIP